MPYIRKNEREILEPLVNQLANQCATSGDFTYAIYLLAKRMLPFAPTYYHLSNIMGCLDCASKEFYRRIVAPYEDKKIVENGDVE